MVEFSKGLCLLAKDALRQIPVSVLFGIFLYFGIVSLSGTQLYERIKLVFIPPKYCPNVVYARGVKWVTFVKIVINFFIIKILLGAALETKLFYVDSNLCGPRVAGDEVVQSILVHVSDTTCPVGHVEKICVAQTLYVQGAWTSKLKTTEQI